MSDSLQPCGLKPAKLFCPWDSPGKNTAVGCHALLQGNLPNPGIEPCSAAMQVDSLPSEPPSINKNLPTSKSLAPVGFTGEFYQTYHRGVDTNPSQILPKNGRRGNTFKLIFVFLIRLALP